jgi:hypothetical protein
MNMSARRVVAMAAIIATRMPAYQGLTTPALTATAMPVCYLSASVVQSLSNLKHSLLGASGSRYFPQSERRESNPRSQLGKAVTAIPLTRQIMNTSRSTAHFARDHT